MPDQLDLWPNPNAGFGRAFLTIVNVLMVTALGCVSLYAIVAAWKGMVEMFSGKYVTSTKFRHEGQVATGTA